MASKVLLKKSSVTAKAPVAGDLDYGELAINYTDGKLYFKKADNTIDYFATGAASAPVSSVGGYIGDVTAANLMTAIQTVDGADSGLDADTLDGNHASAFYLASNPNGYTSNTGTITSVGATAPVVSSGGTAPTLSMAAATALVDGYMTSTYAAKLDGIATGATANTGTVTSVSMTVPTGLSITGSPITTTGSLDITLAAGYSIPTTASQTNWDTAYSDRNKWDGGATGLVAATGRTSLGLVIGTNVQAWDGALDAISSITANGVLVKTGANTWATKTGIDLTTLSTITQNDAFNITTPGLVDYGLKFIGALGSNDRATGMTWTNASNGANIAGIYVQTSSAYGSKMYIATSDSPSTGAKNAISIDQTGLVNFIRQRPTYSGNVILDAGNYSTYAQPVNTKLTAIAALLPTADNFIVGNGTTWTLETPAQARTSLGATTVGSNLFILPNVAAISFPRINADNTVSTLDAATFRTAIGAGTGTVTSVSGTGTVSGLTLTGTVTSSGSLTLGGAITGFLPLTGGTLTGALTVGGAVNWNAGSSIMNSGNPRSLAIGYSGGNYGGAGYGINYTTTSSNHTYAIADVVSRWDAQDGLMVYSAPAGTVGASVSWTTVLDARRSNTSLIFKGNTVLDSSNYNSYSPTLTGTGASGTWGINITGASTSVGIHAGNEVNCGGSYAGGAGTTLYFNYNDGGSYGNISFYNGGTGLAQITAAQFNGPSTSCTGNAATATTAANGGVTSVNGSTGAVTISGGQYLGTAATKAISYNSNTISENITIAAGQNGLSAGPITISTGNTVTVATGAVWVIV